VSGRFHDKTGRFPSATDRFRSNTGRFRSETGPFRSATDPFQSKTGRFRSAPGPFQSKTGPFQSKTGPYTSAPDPYKSSPNRHTSVPGWVPLARSAVPVLVGPTRGTGNEDAAGGTRRRCTIGEWSEHSGSFWSEYSLRCLAWAVLVGQLRREQERAPPVTNSRCLSSAPWFWRHHNPDKDGWRGLILVRVPPRRPLWADWCGCTRAHQ
jgi:hypothetical protein